MYFFALCLIKANYNEIVCYEKKKNTDYNVAS